MRLQLAAPGCQGRIPFVNHTPRRPQLKRDPLGSAMTKDPRASWDRLTHAYGAAGDIPALLERARFDLRSGSDSASAWFELWSALCHQGDAYTASYAAAKHLVVIAKAREGKEQYDPLSLLGCIELARLEGRAPPIPDDLLEEYERAKNEAARMIEALLVTQLDKEWRTTLSADLASLQGHAAKARALLDADWELGGEGAA